MATRPDPGGRVEPPLLDTEARTAGVETTTVNPTTAALGPPACEQGRVPLPSSECTGKRLYSRSAEMPRDLRFRAHAVEAVERSFDDVHVAGGACGSEPLGVVEVLVVEQIERADADPGRWEGHQQFRPVGGLGQGPAGDPPEPRRRHDHG